MSLQDPIADMLTRIRNAQAKRMKTVSMPSAKIKQAIAEVLKVEGYIIDYSVAGDDAKKPELTIELKYFEDKPVIATIKRISRTSLRVYKQAKDLEKVLGGLGIAIVSTSQGLMTDKQARQVNLGGEVLCEVA
jgi:small subunit ribosomal protein S8